MGSALDSASLIMYPSGYSDGVLGSAKPTDGSGDFTFTRGSNLSATRVGPNGYIEKGYENLLLQSNTFDTSPWGGAGISVTGGQAGYDGTNDAWLLTSTITGFPRITQNISYTGVASYSVYLKAGTDSFAQVRTFGIAASIWVELTGDGTISATSGEIYHSITSLGNGWYRVQMSVNGSLTSVRIYPASAVGTYSTSGNGIVIQDAQINQGLVAYPYIETTTAPVAGGILEDEPRIDFSDSCGHLLLEPSRTNYIPYTEYFNGLGGNAGLNFNYNDATSPEGLTNAVQVVSNNTGQSYIGYFNGASTAGDNTLSVFAKYDNCQYICLRASFFAGGDDALVWFDIQNGTKGSSTGSSVTYDIKDYGNGWYRCYVTHNVDAGDLSGTGRVYLSDADGGFNSALNQAAHLYGLQWEQGSYPTSYIPTYGSSSTRLSETLADSIDIGSFTSTYNTLFFDWGDMEGKSTFNNDIVRGWATTDNTFPVFRIVSLSDGRLRYQVYTSVSSESANYTCTTRDKVAFVFNGLNSKLFINGSLVYAYSLDVTQGLRKFNYNGLSRNLTNQFIIFPTALSDDECIALTTI